MVGCGAAREAAESARWLALATIALAVAGGTAVLMWVWR